jgi:death-on-curing protein
VFGKDAYPDLYTKVAALFESLACNHVFVDGNKRTAVVAAMHMLYWNGLDLIADDTDVVNIALAVALHEIDVSKLAEFFRRNSVPLDYEDGPTRTDGE